jgi:hypothetical protein
MGVSLGKWGSSIPSNNEAGLEPESEERADQAMEERLRPCCKCEVTGEAPEARSQRDVRLRALRATADSRREKRKRRLVIRKAPA